MYPTLFHIYGPFQISSFGLMIAVGILVFIYLTLNDSKLMNYICRENFLNLVVETAIAAIIGARILHVLSELHNYRNVYEIFRIWEGGMTVLGAMISGITYLLWYFHKKKIPLFPILDIGISYVPIIHSISRIGCFLSGCCFGTTTNILWAISYSNPEVAAPLNISIHPTQIYSSIIFFLIFLILRYASKSLTKSGQITFLYFILASTERIIIDFFRGDRSFIISNTFWATKFLSFHQIIALLIIIFSCTGFLFSEYLSKKRIKHESI